MLFALTLAKLIAELGMMFLLGQGALWVLAGVRRDTNPVYQLFQVVNRPWLRLARWMAPRQVADQHVGFVAFFALAVVWMAIVLARIEHCISVGVQLCR